MHAFYQDKNNFKKTRTFPQREGTHSSGQASLKQALWSSFGFGSLQLPSLTVLYSPGLRTFILHDSLRVIRPRPHVFEQELHPERCHLITTQAHSFI